jgi:hypothetical protein
VKTRTIATTAFLSLTALTVGTEVFFAFDASPNTLPWTQIIAQHVPWPVTALAIFALIVWLPGHFIAAYRERNGASTHRLNTSNEPIQIKMDNTEATFTPTGGRYHVGTLSGEPRIIKPEPEILEDPNLGPNASS